jgi:phosphinothricin acetyltransferase
VGVRLATDADAASIAGIYNEGITDRIATFETRLRTADDIRAWFDGRHPIVVAEEGGAVVGFASTSTYRPRDAYAGVAEFGVYVARSHRGRGIGRALMEALANVAAERGFWKLVSRVFVENTASRALLTSVGFREVGIYRRHGKLDGRWRDVVVVELLIGEASNHGEMTISPDATRSAPTVNDHE